MERGVEVSGQKKKTGIFIQIKDRGPGLTDWIKRMYLSHTIELEHELSDSHSGLRSGYCKKYCKYSWW